MSSDEFIIVFGYGFWRLFMWDTLISSHKTKQEAEETAAKVLKNPNPLRAYMGLAPLPEK